MSNNDNVNVCITEETRVVKYATIVVNGTERGKREINGTPTLSDFAKAIAAEFGIKTFTVSVDDVNVTSQTQAEAPVSDGTKVAVAAKDSRGANRRSNTREEKQPEPAEQPSPAPTEEKAADAPTSDETMTT